MAVFCYSATCIPTEWFFIIIPVIFAPPIIVFFLMRRSKPEEGASPVEQRNVWLQPVDDAGTMQMGDLLAGADRTEDTLLFWHPDWVDEEGNNYHAEVPIEKEQPGRALDADKNVVELWVVVKRGEELEVVSFSSIANKLPARFDPLPANPRKVGRFYVGWPFGKASGLASLIQSTTGKLLAFGGVAFIFFLLGILTSAANHLGFTH